MASQTGASAEERQLAFIDRNRDLYTCSLQRTAAARWSYWPRVGQRRQRWASACAGCPTSVEHCRWSESE